MYGAISCSNHSKGGLNIPTPPLTYRPRPKGARKSTDDPAASSVASHGYVKSFDGTKIFYSVEGSGLPLVFCYGLVCSSLHWTYQIEHFRHNFQTIWFDYRGHQNSELPQDLGSLTLENMAKDLRVVLDELNVSKAVVLGHSMGVNVALEFYKQYPERVGGLILANGTAQRALDTLFFHNAFQTGFKLLKKLYRSSPKALAYIWRSQKRNPLIRSLVTIAGFNSNLTPQADIQAYVNQVCETDPAIMVHLIDHYGAYDATSWISSIVTPTLIIAGENDIVIPLAQQELMAQLIPGSQLEVIRHGSHCPQMDLPELVNHKIENFLNQQFPQLKSFK